MEAIILAGGFGTRLKHIVSDVPKPMAPVNDKPFLEYIFEDLNTKGFKRCILAVGYKSETIINHFGYKYKNIDIVYSFEDEPLGTGGAIKQALSYCDEDYVFIVNGDTFFDCDFVEMKRQFDLNKSDIVIATKEMHNYDRYGTIVIDHQHYITQFEEKKFKKDGLINGGIYLVRSDLLDKFIEKRFSFETNVLESMDYKMLSVESQGYFIDIGIPEDYYRAQQDFKHGK